MLRSLLERMRRPSDCAGFEDCKELRELLQHHLEGQLDPELTARIADRLEACRACGLEFSTYVEIKGSLERLGRPSNEALDRLSRFADELIADEHGEGDGSTSS